MTILDHPQKLAALLEKPSDDLVVGDQVSVREPSIYATWAPRRRGGGGPLPLR